MTPEQLDLVKGHRRLVVAMACRWFRPGGHLLLEDLIQEGSLGLVTAAKRFDPGRGVQFRTYASWWIRHAISRATANTNREVRVPVETLRLGRKLACARKEIEADDRVPNDTELASAANVTVSAMGRMRNCLAMTRCSLDAPLAENDPNGSRLADLLEDHSAVDPIEQQHLSAICSKVLDFMVHLPPIEADVLRKRFGLEQDAPMTLREIGERYSLSRERIRQLQEQALAKIRRELRRSGML